MKEIILGIFGDLLAETQVLNNANTASFKVNTDLFQLY